MCHALHDIVCGSDSQHPWAAAWCPSLSWHCSMSLTHRLGSWTEHSPWHQLLDLPREHSCSSHHWTRKGKGGIIVNKTKSYETHQIFSNSSMRCTWLPAYFTDRFPSTLPSARKRFPPMSIVFFWSVFLMAYFNSLTIALQADTRREKMTRLKNLDYLLTSAVDLAVSSFCEIEIHCTDQEQGREKFWCHVWTRSLWFAARFSSADKGESPKLTPPIKWHALFFGLPGQGAVWLERTLYRAIRS